jgi:hypothetical protein
MSQRPALLIDVDGPLNPYAQSNRQMRKGKQFAQYKLEGYTVWLTRWHGEELNKLAETYELVWCTTWEHLANELIAPRVGLRQLPVIEWPPGAINAPANGRCWKTEHVVEWAQGRPFAWIDDDIEEADQVYVAEHHDGPALLHWVSAFRGLTETDFTTLAAWAATLTQETR